MTIPQIEPVTSLSRNYRSVFEKLTKGPVFLAQRSRPAAVLLSLNEYERITKRLRHLELLMESKRIFAEMESDSNNRISQQELKRLIAEKADTNVAA